MTKKLAWNNWNSKFHAENLNFRKSILFVEKFWIFGQSRLTNERRARRRQPINDPDLIRIKNRTKLVKLHFRLREKK